MAITTKPNNAQVVTPSDTVDLAQPSSWLSFINSGTQTITIDTVGGQKNVTILLPSGMWPLVAKRVYSTGTTVTNIVEYWNS